MILEGFIVATPGGLIKFTYASPSTPLHILIDAANSLVSTQLISHIPFSHKSLRAEIKSTKGLIFIAFYSKSLDIGTSSGLIGNVMRLFDRGVELDMEVFLKIVQGEEKKAVSIPAKVKYVLFDL
jgi:hypothetical protein